MGYRQAACTWLPFKEKKKKRGEWGGENRRIAEVWSFSAGCEKRPLHPPFSGTGGATPPALTLHRRFPGAQLSPTPPSGARPFPPAERLPPNLGALGGEMRAAGQGVPLCVPAPLPPPPSGARLPGGGITSPAVTCGRAEGGGMSWPCWKPCVCQVCPLVPMPPNFPPGKTQTWPQAIAPRTLPPPSTPPRQLPAFGSALLLGGVGGGGIGRSSGSGYGTDVTENGTSLSY